MSTATPHISQKGSQTPPGRTLLHQASRGAGLPSAGLSSAGLSSAGLSSAGLSLVSPLPQPAVFAPVRLLPGRPVPGTRFRIVRWLGEGGMGVIFEAEHLDVERRLALKVLKEDLHDRPDLAQEFRREARTASQIGSEYIVEIFDLGTLPDGRLFMAIELVDGHDLFDEVTSAPIAFDRLIPILRQIAKGLGAAHRAGIVHRDIKPENVLIAKRRGRSDAVKIVDFGVSRVMTSTRVEDHAVGTPVYMAPECWTGEPADHRIDIYALGCLAYELVAGQPPFDGTSNEVMLAHIEDAPPPLSSRVPSANIPEPLEAWIMRCLAKRPDQRFADMQDLEAALCEAQIASGIETAWDDLELPDVEVARRDRLLSEMPSTETVVVRGARWVWAVVAVLVLALGVVGALALRPDADVAEAARSEVEELVDGARAAASRAYFAYPPADGADETAFRRVLDLERIEGEAHDLAHDRAEVLRSEFAATLVRLGDRYWGREGGRWFAVDYYAQALLFSPEHELARERVPFSMAEMAVLRLKAASLDFSRAEREAVAPLVLLAAEDEKRAMEALGAYYTEDRAASLTRDAHVARLLTASGRTPRRAREPQRPANTAKLSATPVADEKQDPVASDGAPAAVAPAAVPPAAGAALASHDVDASGARKLVGEAKSAARSGAKNRAESLYHQALAKDRRSSRALIGLSELHFDQAHYLKAMEFATKAVRLAPRNKNYRILLGDSLYKLMRYSEAEQHYKRAKRLGHPSAEGRLGKLRKRLGG